MKPLRKFSLRSLHRQVGLAVAMLLLLCAATGFALVWLGPLERFLQPSLYSGHGSLRSVQALVNSIEQRFGNQAKVTLRLPQLAGQAVRAEVATPRWTGELILDPDTAQILQQTEALSTLRSVVFELHSNLLLGQFGKAALAIGSAFFAGLFLTGLVVGWPRSARAWRELFKVRTHLPARIAWADSHRALGFVIGWAVLLSVASGTYMVWRPLSHGLTALLGQQRVLPAELHARPLQSEGAKPLLSSLRTGSDFDAMVAKANTELPDGAVVYVSYHGVEKAVRIRKRLPDDPHPNGLSSVWLDPLTCTVLKTVVWTQLDFGSRAFAWVYPFHSGQLWGAPHAWLNALMGLSLLGFVVSGLATWWKRRVSSSPYTTS